MPDNVLTLTLARSEWDLIKLSIGGYADSVNFHSQSATLAGRREMLCLVAHLHRLAAKLHELTGAPSAQEILERRAADTMAEATAVQVEMA